MTIPYPLHITIENNLSSQMYNILNINLVSSGCTQVIVGWWRVIVSARVPISIKAERDIYTRTGQTDAGPLYNIQHETS